MGLSSKRLRHAEAKPKALLGIDKESARTEVIERLKFQVTFAETMFRSLMLVNGGAIIGLFTFIGNHKPETSAFALSTSFLWIAFGFFCAGLAAALVSIAGAYFSQQYFYEVSLEEVLMSQRFDATGDAGQDERRRPHRLGQIAQWVGVGGAIVSALCFMFGAGLSLASVLPN